MITEEQSSVAVNSALAPRQKVAYMLGTFPELTQTFVLREIQGLQVLGLDVEVFAVKRAPALCANDLADPELLKRCVIARPDGTLRILAINLVQAALHPRKYWSTLKCFASVMRSLEPGLSLRTLYHAFCGIGFASILRRYKVSHMHAHFTTGANVALAANIFGGIPFSWTAHASGDLFVWPVLLEEKLKRAQFAVAVCEYSRAYLDAVTGYRYSQKIRRVYNGVDPDEPERMLEGRVAERRPEQGRVRIVSVGKLSGVKGHATLIEACRLLKGRAVQIECEVIGDGPERPVLEEMIERSGLHNTVRITGYQSLAGVYAAMADAEIFVLLSEIRESGYRDGFPTVILESMLLGLPVVATTISGIPEMVVHGKTGYLVPERDSVSAAEAISALACDSELRKRFGAAGRRRTIELFNLKTSIAEKARLIREYAGAA